LRSPSKRGSVSSSPRLATRAGWWRWCGRTAAWSTTTPPSVAGRRRGSPRGPAASSRSTTGPAGTPARAILRRSSRNSPRSASRWSLPAAWAMPKGTGRCWTWDTPGCSAAPASSPPPSAPQANPTSRRSSELTPATWCSRSGSPGCRSRCSGRPGSNGWGSAPAPWRGACCAGGAPATGCAPRTRSSRSGSSDYWQAGQSVEAITGILPVAEVVRQFRAATP